MSSKQSDGGTSAGVDFPALFEAFPSPCLVLAPDAPDFTIMAVNEDYLRGTLAPRRAILGQSVLTAFSNVQGGDAAEGGARLHASLMRVLATSQPDWMQVEKRTIRQPDEVSVEERDWRPINTPLLGSDGALIAVNRLAKGTPDRRSKGTPLRAACAGSP